MISKTALNLLEERKTLDVLSFGCSILDDATGGISYCGVTEIAGEAGTGKTQICLTLAVRCVLSGITRGTNANVAYMSCGEGNFPLRRFIQLAEATSSPDIDKDNLLESVHVDMCHTIDDAFESVDHRIPLLCRAGKTIRLVIIDSLAGLIRTEYDTRTVKDMASRTTVLFKFASKLKWLADTYKIGVVVVNQVTAAGFDRPSSSSDLHIGSNWSSVPPSSSSGVRAGSNWAAVVPSMGLAWTHCVNTRLMLERDAARILADNTDTTESVTIGSNLNNVQFNHQEPQQIHDKLFNSFDGHFIQLSSIKNEYQPPPTYDDLNNRRGVNENLTFHGDNQVVVTKDDVSTSHASFRSRRRLTVVFSPSRPNVCCGYEITTAGVVGCELK